MSSLQNKRAIVTGGAKGIGKAVVHRLQHEGASVLALDIVEPEYDVEFRKCDVRSEQALEEISANETRVDILVNNAGVYLRAAVVETSGEDLDRIIDTNLKGPYLCCKHFLPVVSPGGCVINIASGLGLVPEPESPAYCSTKAGLVMLTKCLAQEYAPKGIRVNAVLPGPIDTPMLRSSLTSEEELEDRFALALSQSNVSPVQHAFGSGPRSSG